MYPVFPQFTKLTLEDKDKYNQLVADYPPFSDIAFSTLHIWWDLDGQLSFAVLNGNLVLKYNLPFSPKDSGISLVGTHEVDNSLNTIFAYLQSHSMPAKLQHVPEFVVEKITDKSGLAIEEEPTWNEYIMDSRALANLGQSHHGRIRRKVARFLREIENREATLMSLDLTSEDAKKLLFDSVLTWDEKYPRHNDPNREEKLALERTLRHSLALDTQNLCLFIDGKLQGVVLYHLTVDRKHYIINHLRVDYEVPFVFDFMTQQIAKKALENNVPYLNMEMDLGIEGLRNHKMSLRPLGFFKKYTVSLKT